MAVKSLQVLFLGTPLRVDKGDMTLQQGKGQIIIAPCLSYLIRTDEGNFLVDVGCHPQDAEKFIHWTGENVAFPPEDRLPNRLAEVGLSMKDIQTVIISHFHFDHIGWLNELSQAEIVVQKMEYLFSLEAPYIDKEKFPERFGDFFPKLKWRLVDGDQVLAPGITLLFTPGHTIGHQSVMVDLPRSGPIILAQDAAEHHENIDQELISFPFFSAREALLSIRKLKVLAQVKNAQIFPDHDLQFYQQKMKKAPEAYF
jgi:N-acyl homoserine lactone hydrolase